MASSSIPSQDDQVELLLGLVEAQKQFIDLLSAGKTPPPELLASIQLAQEQLETSGVFRSLHHGLKPPASPDPSVVPLLTASIDPLKVDANVFLPPALRGSITHGVAGLQNVGNTCFINSTLQCLMAADLFRNRVLSLSFLPEPSSPEPLTRRAHKYATLIWTGPRASSTPLPTQAWVAVLPSWLGGYRQQDAQEFLLWLLDRLREEAKLVIKAFPASREAEERARNGATAVPSRTGAHSLRATRLFADTWIDEIFGGLAVSAVTCSQCHTVTQKYEANYMVSLQLPLEKLGLPVVAGRHTRPIRLEECLAEYFEPAQIDLFSCLNCTLIDRVLRATDAAVSKAVDRLPSMEPASLLQSAELLLQRCAQLRVGDMQAKVDALVLLRADSTDKHALYQLQDTLLHTANKLQRLDQTIARMKCGDASVFSPSAGVLSTCVQLVRSLEDLLIELDMIREIIDYAASAGKASVRDPQLMQRPAVRKESFHHQPSVLILHIKRFHISLTSSTKLQHVIRFPMELDLNPFMSGDYFEALASGSDLSSTHYQLFGVIEHQGQLNSGHYVAFVEKPTGWYRCSDSHVTQATVDQVLKADAYILFYRRF